MRDWGSNWAEQHELDKTTTITAAARTKVASRDGWLAAYATILLRWEMGIGFGTKVDMFKPENCWDRLRSLPAEVIPVLPLPPRSRSEEEREEVVVLA